MKNRLAVTLTLLISSSACVAGEVYGGYGVFTGLNLGYGHRINDMFGLRGEAHSLSLKRKFDADDGRYDVKFEVSGGAAYADFHPFSGSFRVTAGVGSGSSKFSGGKEFSGGTINIGDNSYTINSGDSVTLTVKYPNTMPYLGIGFGHNRDKPGLGFYTDIGAFIGSPKASIRVSDNLKSMSGVTDADIRAEEQKAQKDLDKLKLLPVFKVGVSYTF